MKEHLLYLLLATVTASTAYGQDACDNTREYDMGECYAYFSAHDCAPSSFSNFSD